MSSGPALIYNVSLVVFWFNGLVYLFTMSEKCVSDPDEWNRLLSLAIAGKLGYSNPRHWLGPDRSPAQQENERLLDLAYRAFSPPPPQTGRLLHVAKKNKMP